MLRHAEERDFLLYYAVNPFTVLLNSFNYITWFRRYHYLKALLPFFIHPVFDTNVLHMLHINKTYNVTITLLWLIQRN